MRPATQRAIGVRSRIVTLAAGASALAYAMFLFVPGQRTLANLESQIEAKRLQVAQSNALVHTIRELEKRWQIVDGVVCEWGERADVTPHAAGTLKAIVQHARECDVEVLSLTPQSEARLARLRMIQVEMEVEGAYGAIDRLLARLDAMGDAVWLERFELTRPTASAETTRASMKLILFSPRTDISG